MSSVPASSSCLTTASKTAACSAGCGGTSSVARRRASRIWTADAVKAIGVLIEFDTAAEILGIGRSTAYELVKAGEFPVARIRIGGRNVIRQKDLLDFLGVD